MKKIFFQSTSMLDLKIINHEPLMDSRGLLKRLYCQKSLYQFIQNKNIKQINQTLTKKVGTVRGLHFQTPPFSETKIISCIKGKVWDVAVDLRMDSPTFLKYHGEELSEYDHKSILIPEGFAHGFQTLTSNCEMLYFHTEDYNKQSEGAVNAIDPKIGIDWPLEISNLSERDKNHSFLKDNFRGITSL